MPIKKSKLESKWYYRVAKTLVLLAPVFFVIYYYGMGYINFNWLNSKDAPVILSSNSVFIGQIIFWAIVYYVGVSVVWRIILYLVFGGLENDTKRNINILSEKVSAPQAVVSGGVSSEAVAQQVIEHQNKRQGETILWIIFIICIIAIAIYGNKRSSFVPGVPNPSPKCIPTGCGNTWRCSGSYYSDNVRRSVNGCYGDKAEVTSKNSWSGTCRRCP